VAIIQHCIDPAARFTPPDAANARAGFNTAVIPEDVPGDMGYFATSAGG